MKRDFLLLAGRQFDLLVCGGGIYGMCTAYAAVLRGLKVALVKPVPGWDAGRVVQEVGACKQ